MTTNRLPGDALMLELLAHAPAWGGESVERQLQQDASLAGRWGTTGLERAREDAQCNLAYLAEAVGAGSPAMFAHYVGWLRSVTEPYGVTCEQLADHLRALQAVVAAHLAGPCSLVDACLEAGLDVLRRTAEPTRPWVRLDHPHGELATGYLDAVLHAERQAALRLVLQAVDGGLALEELYLHVLQPVQREVGRLWQVRRISVAEEHVATSITHTAMSLLAPRLAARPRRGRVLVAACVSDEQHDVGLHMVADVLEMAGWTVIYLGANSPGTAVVHAVKQHGAQAVALSVSTALRLPTLRRTLAQLRDACGVPTMVGGPPFTVFPELAEQVGAHATAVDAQHALREAERLVVPAAP